MSGNSNAAGDKLVVTNNGVVTQFTKSAVTKTKAATVMAFTAPALGFHAVPRPPM